jgi:hypothetical protein
MHHRLSDLTSRNLFSPVLELGSPWLMCQPVWSLVTLSSLLAFSWCLHMARRDSGCSSSSVKGTSHIGLGAHPHDLANLITFAQARLQTQSDWGFGIELRAGTNTQSIACWLSLYFDFVKGIFLNLHILNFYQIKLPIFC